MPAIKARRSVFADVCTMGIAEWLLLQHRNRSTARWSRLDDQVYFAGSEREDDRRDVRRLLERYRALR